MKHYNKIGKAMGRKAGKKRMGGGNTMMAKKNGKKMMAMTAKDGFGGKKMKKK